MSREFNPKPEPTVAQRFSPEQSPSVHNYFDQIMATRVPLYEIAASEKSSPEKFAAQIAEAIAENTPLFQGLKNAAEKLMQGRRDFYDQLIQTTGGGDETGVPFKALKLERFATTKSYIIVGLVAGIIDDVIVKFLKNEPQAITEVMKDPEFQRRIAYLESVNPKLFTKKRKEQTIRNTVVQHLANGVAYKIGLYH